MEVDPQVHAWNEELEEEEEEVGLLGRQFRQHNSSFEEVTLENAAEEAGKREDNVTEIAEKTEELVAEIAEKTEELVAERTEETGTEIAEKTEDNGTEIAEITAENGAEKTEENGTEEAKKSDETGHSKSVYFEPHQGGSTHGVSGMEFNATESSALEISEDLDSRENKFEIEPITRNEFNVENEKILPREILSGLNPVVAQKLHDLTVETVEDLQNPAEKDAQNDITGEVDDELVDLDVEGVLEKQNTHDLFCPNCNSCITRRVILLRRKKRVKNIRWKPGNKLVSNEWNLNLPYDASGKGLVTLDAPNDNIGDQLIISRGGTPIAPAIDPNNDGPVYVSSDAAPPPSNAEIFRCLSCFSLFIPTANGCKLFQCFGGGSDHVSTPVVQNQPDPTGNWWSKIFSSTKKASTSTANVASINVEPLTVQTKPPELQPVQTEPLGAQSIDQQLVPTKPAGQQPVDPMSFQTKPLEDQLVVTLPAQVKPMEPQPTDSKPEPTDLKSVQTKPQGPQPSDSKPEPTDPKPVQTKPQGPQPVDLHPVQTKLPRTHTVQAHAVETHPKVSLAAQVKPSQKYWIFRIFSPDKKEVSMRQQEDDAVIIDVEPQPIEPPPSQTKPLQTPLLQPHSAPTDTAQTQHLQAPPLDTQPLEMPETEPLPAQETQPLQPQTTVPVETGDWDILKSIVYGGLVESIASLGVVSSAAGAGTKTLNILALGLASVVGGLFIMADKIKELKNDNTQTSEQEDRYERLLGRRQNFVRHAIVAVLSYLFFGLLPPVVYGFSFRESDDRDLKIAALAGSSLICIVLLAAAKAHVQGQSYWKTVMYYVSLGVAASGISYVVGDLFDVLMEKLGLFKSSAEVMVPFLETNRMNGSMMKTEWSSY